jgi:vacuolar-type H+-ATPase subunit F/Vma7
VATVAFIGDELTATGYRLAGARAWIVPPEEAGEALRVAREEAGLVLITPAHARHVPGDELEEALRSFTPLVLVVDDILEREAPPDLERAMRSALGVEAA